MAAVPAYASVEIALARACVRRHGERAPPVVGQTHTLPSAVVESGCYGGTVIVECEAPIIVQRCGVAKTRWRIALCKGAAGKGDEEQNVG